MEVRNLIHEHCRKQANASSLADPLLASHSMLSEISQTSPGSPNTLNSPYQLHEIHGEILRQLLNLQTFLPLPLTPLPLLEGYKPHNPPPTPSPRQP